MGKGKGGKSGGRRNLNRKEEERGGKVGERKRKVGERKRKVGERKRKMGGEEKRGEERRGEERRGEERRGEERRGEERRGEERRGEEKRGEKGVQKRNELTWQWWFAVVECQQRGLDGSVSANQCLALLIDLVPVWPAGFL